MGGNRLHAPRNLQILSLELFVHPLLFEVLTDQEPRLNWENNAWRWVDPGDIAQYETVPRLWETWQRVASPAKNQDASPAR